MMELASEERLESGMEETQRKLPELVPNGEARLRLGSREQRKFC